MLSRGLVMSDSTNPRRCQERSPINEWQCNRSRHYGDPNHRARDPEGPPMKLNGCIIEDMGMATVEEWQDVAWNPPEIENVPVDLGGGLTFDLPTIRVSPTGPMSAAFINAISQPAAEPDIGWPDDEALDELFRCYCGVRIALGATKTGELYWYHVNWSPDPDHEVGRSGPSH